MKCRALSMVVCCCAGLLAPHETALCRAADQPLAWAPQDSLFYLGVPNCDALAEAFKKTAPWKMKDDPAVKDAIQPWTKVADKLLKLVARRLGLDDADALKVYPHGALAIYMEMLPPPGDAVELDGRLALIADMGDDASKMTKLCKAIVARCGENGAHKETKEVAGGEITVISFPTDEAEDGDKENNVTADHTEFADEVIEILQSEKIGLNEALFPVLRQGLSNVKPPDEFAFAKRGTKFIVAVDEASARQALKLLRDGGEKSLAATPIRRALKRHGDAGAHVQIAFNTPALVPWLQATGDEDVTKRVRALGLEDIGPAVMTLTFAPRSGVETKIRGFLEVKNAQKGLGKILMMKNTPLKPPATVGADALIYGSANVNIPAIVDEVIAITGRIDPAEAEAMRAGMKAPQPDGSVLDIRQDILEHLSGPLFGAFSAEKPYGTNDLNFFIGLGHNSRAALDKLAAMLPPGMFVQREMMGAAIYDIPIMMGLASGLTDRALLISGTKNAIEGYVRAEGKSGGGLADNAFFRRMAKHVAKECCVVVYSNAGLFFEAQQAIVKRLGPNPPPPGFGSPIGAFLEMSLAQNDYASVLDHPEALTKYQASSLLTVSTQPDGLSLDVVSMLPGRTD